MEIMRELVIKTVVKNFEAGLDELGMAFVRKYWNGDGNHHPLYIQYESFNDRHQKELQYAYERRELFGINIWAEINKRYAKELYYLLQRLDNESLLRCLDGQLCQQYR